MKITRSKSRGFDGSKWLRVSDTLVRDDRVEAKAHMLDAYPHLQSMYSLPSQKDLR